MLPRPTLEAFDAWLLACSLELHAFVVGGAALALLGVIERQTRDVDILHPKLPEEVVTAAREFATNLRLSGIELSNDWLNNGPLQLAEVLPRGWQSRGLLAFEGKALRLTTLGRADLLKSKLFALCDRGTDLMDCVALAPTRGELEEAWSWLAHQDANPMWPDHVRDTLEDLQRRLARGI